MTVRAIFAALIVCCGLSAGCCTRSGATTPPPYRVCNLQRLYDELAWFYADLQDTIFGVDYYYYMDHEYEAHPY